MLLSSDDIGLTGLWFYGAKYFAHSLSEESLQTENQILKETKRWLDIFFSGKEPDFMPILHITGSPFQKEVWKILLEVSYGKTTTYGEIAKIIAENRGLHKMSAQAVGGAVGHNPISIIIPCHRVIGSNGSLTGYAGGIDKKIYLLNNERDNECFSEKDAHG